MKSLRIAVSAAVLSTLFACPPDPKVVAEKTAKDTSSLIREAWQSGEQTNDWQSVDKFFEGTFGIRRGRTENTSAIYVPAVSNFDTGSDTAGKSLGRVFDKSNVVKTEGGAVFFRVRGVDLCVDSGGIVNTSCADAIDRMAPQLKVYGDLDIAILLGTSKVEAAVFHLVSKKSIAVDFDLSKAKEVAELMQRAFNPSSTPVLSGDASGKMQVKLTKNADYDFTVSFSILNDVNVAWNTDSITSRSYFLQARTPALEVHLNAPAKSLTAKIDFGTIRYVGKGEEVGLAYSTANGVDATIAGLTADFLLDDSNYKLSNVGIGGSSSTIKSGSSTLLQLDLNASLGRKVDLSAVQTTDGIRVSAVPGLTIDAQTNFGSISGVDYRVPQELRNVKYAFSFTGGTPTLDFFLRRAANSQTSVPFTKIVDGTIKVKVDSTAQGDTDNLAVCNSMKNNTDGYYSQTCGGLNVPVNCSSLTLNAFENSQYLSCVMYSYECASEYNSSTGNYDYSWSLNQSYLDDCHLMGNRSVPETTFNSGTCLTYNQSPTNTYVSFFTGTMACP